MSGWSVVPDVELEALRAEIIRLRGALNAIASWSEGPVVDGGFDEPTAARMARAALAVTLTPGWDANGSPTS